MSEIVEVRVLSDDVPYYKCPVCGRFMRKTFTGFLHWMEEIVTDFECSNPKCKGFEDTDEDEEMITKALEEDYLW